MLSNLENPNFLVWVAFVCCDDFAVEIQCQNLIYNAVEHFPKMFGMISIGGIISDPVILHIVDINGDSFEPITGNGQGWVVVENVTKPRVRMTRAFKYNESVQSVRVVAIFE